MTSDRERGTAEPGDLTSAAVERLNKSLFMLSEAGLRLNERLVLDTVLQGVLEFARSLTGARYGVLTLLDKTGIVENHLCSGLTDDQSQQLWDVPEGMRLFEYFSGIEKPLRVPDLPSHVRRTGLPKLLLPVAVDPGFAFMAVPLLYQGRRVGHVYVAEKEAGPEFTGEDEETLVIFASLAAIVIANARQQREEMRLRADLETLIDTSPVGVVLFDARAGIPVSYNREAARIIARLRKPDEPLEKLLQIMTVRREDGRSLNLEELQFTGALMDGETVRAEEIVLQTPDGRRVAMLLNATPIRSEKGEVESYVVTIQDMVPLEERVRRRGTFLAAVSQELRTPLTSIKGSASALIKSGASLDPAEASQFHRIIDEQADHMQGLISDLLDLARIEAGALSITPRPSDLATLVDLAGSTFSDGGGRGNVRVDLPRGLPRVMADRRRIVRVLATLLDNVTGPPPEVSTIRVRAAREGVHVAISVASDGVRLSPDHLARLFRSYPRLDEDDSGVRSGGPALGLAICRGIVEAHGGRIWADLDGPGPGARFTFTIPAVEAETPITGPAAALAGEAGTGRVRILAVDDDSQALGYLREALSQAGYVPLITRDPAEVPRLVKEKRPHLALLDLTLPGFEGIEIMENIPELARVPVIFLSPYGDDHAVAHAMEAGGDDYLFKPFSPTELTARIQAVLRRRRRIEEPGVPPSAPYVLGDLRVDYDQGRAFLAGRPLRLTGIEYRLLCELSANAGRPLTHAQLLRRVWGQRPSGGSGPLRTTVKNLRRKLGDDAADPTYIFNKRSVGYRMAPSQDSEPRAAAAVDRSG